MNFGLGYARDLCVSQLLCHVHKWRIWKGFRQDYFFELLEFRSFFEIRSTNYVPFLERLVTSKRDRYAYRNVVR